MKVNMSYQALLHLKNSMKKGITCLVCSFLLELALFLTKQQQPPKASKRKACGELPQVIMDNNQMMILGNIYETWLKDVSSLVSKKA